MRVQITTLLSAVRVSTIVLANCLEPSGKNFCCYLMLLVFPLLNTTRDRLDNVKQDFFKTAVEAVLVYGSSSWELTKNLEANLDGIHVHAHSSGYPEHLPEEASNKTTLYGKISPISKVNGERRTLLA